MVSRLLCKAFITLDELITPLHPKNNGLSTVFSNTHSITMKKHCVLQIFVKNGKCFKATDSILSKHTNTISDHWCKHVISILLTDISLNVSLIISSEINQGVTRITSQFLISDFFCNLSRYLYLFRHHLKAI